MQMAPLYKADRDCTVVESERMKSDPRCTSVTNVSCHTRVGGPGPKNNSTTKAIHGEHEWPSAVLSLFSLLQAQADANGATVQG